jgi:hypothetical protein
MPNPSTINIDGVEYVRADSIKPLGNTSGTPFEVGKAYLIRTVTMILTGRVIGVVGSFLVLNEAAWIADTGRFNEALKTGELNEVEPADGNVFVGITAIIDVYEWNHSLLRVAK